MNNKKKLTSKIALFIFTLVGIFIVSIMAFLLLAHFNKSVAHQEPPKPSFNFNSVVAQGWWTGGYAVAR